MDHIRIVPNPGWLWGRCYRMGSDKLSRLHKLLLLASDDVAAGAHFWRNTEKLESLPVGALPTKTTHF